MKKSLSVLSAILFALGVQAQASNVQVKITTSEGSGYNHVKVSMYTAATSWQDKGYTNPSGMYTIPNLNGNMPYTLRFTTDNGTVLTTAQFTTPANGIQKQEYHTSKLTITASNCTNGVAGVQPTFYGTYWFNMPVTGANGVSTAEVFPMNNMITRTWSNNTYKQDTVKVFPYGTNQQIDQHLALLQLGAGEWFINSNQSWSNVSGYVFPKDYTARIGSGATYTKHIATTCDGYPVIVHLNESDGDAIQGAGAQYYDWSQYQWVNMPNTDANGNSIVYLNAPIANAATRVIYRGSSLQHNDGMVSYYQTINYAVNFRDPSNTQDRQPTFVSYYDWSQYQWVNLPTQNAGTNTIEMLPVGHSFLLGYLGKTQQIDASANDLATTFNTANYTVNFKNYNNTGDELASSISYYDWTAYQWKPFSNTTASGATMEMLPVGQSFLLGYKGRTQQIDLGANQFTANYKTTRVALWAHQCTGIKVPVQTDGMSYYDWSTYQWMPVGTGFYNTVDVLPVSQSFLATVNGTSKQMDVNVPSQNTLDTVDFIAVKVKTAGATNAKYYNWSSYQWLPVPTTGMHMFPSGAAFIADNQGQLNTSITGTTCEQVVTFPTINTQARMADMGDGIRGGFAVYPNPATSTINVDVTEDGKVSVVSLDGKTVINKEVSNGHNSVDISALPSGTYMLISGSNTAKFIKQ
jgi:Secretion system C-terminal sorting domain